MDVFDFRARAESGLDSELEALATSVIGGAIEVHRAIGPGMPEHVYRNALSHELTLRGIAHECEVPVPIHYKGKLVGEGRMDLLVDGRLVVELKSVEALSEVHRSQILAYLCATKRQLGLLINFNVAMLKDGLRRVINSS